jgi:hypothetical protein
MKPRLLDEMSGEWGVSRAPARLIRSLARREQTWTAHDADLGWPVAMRDQRLPMVCVAERGMRLVGDPSGDRRLALQFVRRV